MLVGSIKLFSTLDNNVVFDVAHDLEFCAVASEVIKDKLFSLFSDVGDSTTDRYFFFKKFSLLNVPELLNKFFNAILNLEFMWIWVLVFQGLQMGHSL